MIAIQDTTFALEPWGCVSQLSYGPSTQSHNPTEKKSPAKKKKSICSENPTYTNYLAPLQWRVQMKTIAEVSVEGNSKISCSSLLQDCHKQQMSHSFV